jgi:hypothetical protein
VVHYIFHPWLPCLLNFVDLTCLKKLSLISSDGSCPSIVERFNIKISTENSEMFATPCSILWNGSIRICG